MSDLNPSTVTICGIDSDLNEEVSKLIAETLRARGHRATVRVERAERPHYLYGSVKEVNEAVDANPGYSERAKEFEDPSLIALNGHFTVNELDGISFKLRGGK